MDRSILGLEDNVALVVGGAGKGMGRSHCVELARAGCDVVVADVADGDAVVEAVEALGRRALFIQCDAVDAASVQNAVDGAIDAFGRLDVAVNNVGGIKAVLSFLDLTEDDWDHALALNLKTVVFGARAQLMAMLKHGTHGRIINISSGTGAVWPSFPAGTAHYGAAKAAVTHLTKSLAVEFAKYGIRVNCVVPGTHELGFAAADSATKPVPGGAAVGPLMRRLGRAEETSRVVVFLASQLSSYMTGQAVVSDGGLGLTLHRPHADPISAAAESVGARPMFDPSQDMFVTT